MVDRHVALFVLNYELVVHGYDRMLGGLAIVPAGKCVLCHLTDTDKF